MPYGQIVMDTKEIEVLRKGLPSLPEKIPQVTSFAINYATDKARTNAWKAIQSRYNIQQKRVYDALTLIKSTPSNLSGGIVADSPHFKLGYFKISPASPQPGKRSVISVSVLKGSSKPLPGSFVAGIQSGHKSVFQRIAASLVKERMGKQGKPLGPKKAISADYTLALAEVR